MTKYSFLLLLIICGSTSCTSKLTKTLKSNDFEYKLKVAENYYAQGKYSNAQILFEDLFPLFKGTARFEDIYFKYAYTSYYQKDYMSAENLFKSYVETFPNSPKAEEADYMRAFCFYKQSPKPALDQTNTYKAIGNMQAFINTHPSSTRLKEASDIIDGSRAKLEVKDYKNAELYYNLGFYKAAAITFATLIENFPDSEKSDEYKFMVIKSYYQYANNSIEGKQGERFDKVVTECIDFMDRYPESKLVKEVEDFKSRSLNYIKLKNEQTKKTA